MDGGTTCLPGDDTDRHHTLDRGRQEAAKESAFFLAPIIANSRASQLDKEPIDYLVEGVRQDIELLFVLSQKNQPYSY